jgi:hypothetical protein
VVGSGLRRSRLVVPGAALGSLPGVEVIAGLGPPARSSDEDAPAAVAE